MDLRALAKAAAGKLHLLTSEEQELLLRELEEMEAQEEKDRAQKEFMSFVKKMWPAFIPGRHHEIVAKAFEDVVNGKIKRLIINMAPRHTKSEFASYLLPAWFLGKYPDKKVIQTSHTAELAVGFGRKVRNLIDSETYHQVFNDVKLKADNKSAGRWATNKGGEYFSIGVGGSVTGKGADLLIIDDPHSEQEAKLAAHKPDIFDSVYDWYTSGPRQRLQPGGAIIIVMTRWSLRDLTGQVIKASQTRGGDEWEVIELPAILPSGKPMWPEFWKLEELLALKDELPVGKWNAQYQQQPTAEEGAIVKREWWKIWTKDRPPACDFVLQSWDTAFLKHNRADFSACTTWGVWTNEDGETNIILLDAFKDRYEFPELKQKAYETYMEWQPDVFLVEAKAAGSPLVFELRRMGIPVSEYSPTKGNDKIVRMNAVADLFASGRIWAPERKFADEVIEEVAAFPAGEHDDLCLVADTMILMADGMEKRIDQVKDGDLVATPDGPRRILAAGCTGYKETMTLKVGQYAIQGTGNHPVATKKGWVCIQDIDHNDAILVESRQEQSSWYLQVKALRQRLLYLMAAGTGAIQTLSKPRTASIFQGLGHYYTGIFGSFTTGPYRQDIKYTTRTAIHQTIDWKTWSASAYLITKNGTKKRLSKEIPANNLSSTLKTYAIWRLFGTQAQRVLNGTKNTLQTLLQNVIPNGETKSLGSRLLARYAKRFLKQKTLASLFAQQPVHQKNATISSEKNSFQSHTHACSATKFILPSKKEKSFVAVCADKPSIEQVGRQAVYNLTVEGSHCYFANKVLVHNCDSTTQALLRFRQGGFLSLQSDYEDRDPVHHRKIAYY